VKELTEQYEQVFRDLGQRLGQRLAELLVASPERASQILEEAIGKELPSFALEAAAMGAATMETEADLGPTSPRILPGLSGRRRRPGEPPPKCGRPDCDRPSRTRGYCQTHYVQWLKAGRP
jgi:hypothetical protein